MCADKMTEPARLIEWTEDLPGIILWRSPLDKITYGTKLSVRESQQATFTYGGLIADKFCPGLYTLTKDCLPVLSVFNYWASDSNGPFKTDVYFSKTKYSIQQPLETSRLYIKNSQQTIELSGHFDSRIISAPKLIKRVASFSLPFSTNDLNKLVSEMIRNIVPKIIEQNHVNIGTCDFTLLHLTELIQESVNIHLDSMGLMIRNLTINSVLQENTIAA
jgi:membrane protease subunit (stomatin/prohibitin family)